MTGLLMLSILAAGAIPLLFILDISTEPWEALTRWAGEIVRIHQRFYSRMVA